MMLHPLKDKEAPTITLPNQDGEAMTVKPGSTGTPMAIFFFPASGSYGCTKEACYFRDAVKGVDVFIRSNVMVIGISGDPVTKQKKFVDEYGLPYPVLSDVDGEARKAYQVKKLLMGLVDGRVTFFIDSKGKVRDVLNSAINFEEHVRFVKKWLTAMELEEKKAGEAAGEAAVEVEGDSESAGTTEAPSTKTEPVTTATL